MHDVPDWRLNPSVHAGLAAFATFVGAAHEPLHGKRPSALAICPEFFWASAFLALAQVIPFTPRLQALQALCSGRQPAARGKQPADSLPTPCPALKHLLIRI